MRKILVFLVMLSLMSVFGVVSVIGVQLLGVNFIANGNPMPQSGDSFVLVTDGSVNTNYIIGFNGTTVADVPIKLDKFPLYLVSSTVSKSNLKSYYNSTVPEPFLTYLKEAVDGQKPFAYIEGDGITTIPKLLDAAKKDIILSDVGMTIPGDYPEGTYIVSGEIQDINTGRSSVNFKLLITRSTTQQTDVTVGSDLSLTATPNPLSFGPMMPGRSSIIPVTLQPGASDLSVSVSITGDSLMQSIQYALIGNSTYAPLNGAGLIVPNMVPFVFDAQLTIPAGTKAKTYSGQIVYTVSENAP